MSSRLYPYQLKPPADFEERIRIMQETPLYLVNTTGPTCFSVRGEDSAETKDGRGPVFKVYIGERQRCTCGGWKADHHGGPSSLKKGPELCMHILYIMIKVLRTPSTNPLAWQVSLLDSEVTQVLQGRFNRQQQDTTNNLGGPKHPFLRKGKNEADPYSQHEVNEGSSVERHPLNADLCPICQDEMHPEQALTYCKFSCGNNLHLRCMKMYADFQRTSSSSKHVACPLCRTTWEEPIRIEPFHQQGGPNQEENGEGPGRQDELSCPPRCFRSRCAGCRTVISLQTSMTFFRCIQCPSKSCDLCRNCFQFKSSGLRPTGSHFHYYVEGNLRGDACSWKPAFKKKSSMLSSSVLPLEFIHDLQTREISASDYDVLLGLDDQRHVTLAQHLLNLLPMATASPAPAPSSSSLLLHGSETNLEENNQEADSVCGSCRVNLSAENKRRSMPCGHVLHENCLLSSIIEYSDSDTLYRLCCPVCATQLFPNLALRTKSKIIRQQQQQQGKHDNKKVARPQVSMFHGGGNNNEQHSSNQLQDMMVNGQELASTFQRLNLSLSRIRPHASHGSRLKEQVQHDPSFSSDSQDFLLHRPLIVGQLRRGKSAPIKRERKESSILMISGMGRPLRMARRLGHPYEKNRAAALMKPPDSSRKNSNSTFETTSRTQNTHQRSRTLSEMPGLRKEDSNSNGVLVVDPIVLPRVEAAIALASHVDQDLSAWSTVVQTQQPQLSILSSSSSSLPQIC